MIVGCVEIVCDCDCGCDSVGYCGVAADTDDDSDDDCCDAVDVFNGVG